MTANADIRERVDAFVSDLEDLIREAIRTRFELALGDAPARASRRGRPPGSRNAARPAGEKAPRGGPKLAAARSPEALARLDASILALVRRRPGVTTEEINAALGTTWREVFRRIKRMLRQKLITKTGRNRHMKYFAAGKK